MITFPLNIKCDGYLCHNSDIVKFEFVGFNGTLPLLEQYLWPEGWVRSPQPDGCADMHYCPEHRGQARGGDEDGYRR